MLFRSRLSLTRCNLIYAGGGHCYLLLPNTEQAKETFDNGLASANQWFLAQFGAALYIAGGYVPCSSHGRRFCIGGWSDRTRR